MSKKAKIKKYKKVTVPRTTNQSDSYYALWELSHILVKRLLFKDYLGLDICEDEEFYIVKDGLITSCTINKPTTADNPSTVWQFYMEKDLRGFKLKKDAEEYLINNAEVLSLNDIKNCLHLNYSQQQSVKNRVKQKLDIK